MSDKKINIKYCGPFFDKSGLAQAANNLYSMLSTDKNINLGVELISLCNLNIKKNIKRFPEIKDYDINFIFSTPYNFKKFIEKDKINIGYTMWETDKAHESFIDSVKDLDMLLVPCTPNEKLFKKLNDNTHILPLPLSINNLASKDNGQEKNKNFTFYSIYEWTERKGGIKSLEAYFREFSNQVDVTFIIKTKGPFIGEINSQVNELKEKLQKEKNIKVFPHVKFIIKNSNESEIKRLHHESHCYVSLSSGEGWGLPLIDAAVHGNLIVSSHPTGATEYINESNLFFPIKAKKAKVSGMDWFKYMDNTHKWLEPDIQDAQKQLRAAYNYWNENDSDTKNKDRIGLQTLVREIFDPKKIANLFLELVNKNIKK